MSGKCRKVESRVEHVRSLRSGEEHRKAGRKYGRRCGEVQRAREEKRPVEKEAHVQ